mmetsp:Transcript_547/g.1756  ORF Transcript_547/g.1756 Transcript_547/m.1756 type:complete len:642 (+) Transcript_547:355-2280(+)
MYNSGAKAGVGLWGSIEPSTTRAIDATPRTQIPASCRTAAMRSVQSAELQSRAPQPSTSRRRGARASSMARCVRLAALVLVVSWAGLLFSVSGGGTGPEEPAPVLRAAAAAAPPPPDAAASTVDRTVLAEPPRKDEAPDHAVLMERDGFAMERDPRTGLLVPVFWEPPPGVDELAHVDLVDGEPTIFLMIASYRDWQCRDTAASALARATHAARVRVAVVQQNRPGDVGCAEPPRPCAEDPAQPLCARASQVRVYEMDANEATGPVYARHVGYRMYRGEAFALQVDAHCVFVNGWDDGIVEQWRRTRNEMAVLSTRRGRAAALRGRGARARATPARGRAGTSRTSRARCRRPAIRFGRRVPSCATRTSRGRRATSGTARSPSARRRSRPNPCSSRTGPRASLSRAATSSTASATTAASPWSSWARRSASACAVGRTATTCTRRRRACSSTSTRSGRAGGGPCPSSGSRAARAARTASGACDASPRSSTWRRRACQTTGTGPRRTGTASGPRVPSTSSTSWRSSTSRGARPCRSASSSTRAPCTARSTTRTSAPTGAASTTRAPRATSTSWRSSTRGSTTPSRRISAAASPRSGPTSFAPRSPRRRGPSSRSIIRNSVASWTRLARRSCAHEKGPVQGRGDF